MEKKGIKLGFEYLKKQKKEMVLFGLFSFLFFIIFYLNKMPMEEVLYAFLLCAFVLSIVSGIDFFKFIKKHKQLEQLRKEICFSMDRLPQPKMLIEEDYFKLLCVLYKEKATLLSQADREKSDMLDYYTMWVHQIKTPIAAMRLLLQSESKQDTMALEGELFKIEQYVEMVLSYIRIGSNSNDFVFKQHSLDYLVKQAIRKYAKLFIKKKIRIELGELEQKILTDEKWFLFVIEQVLSNALKYTKEGTIRIYIEEEKNLVIEDSGIGIEAEDLPRVFEKGYTGYNGRYDKRSTGIGLYLSKQVLNKLGHRISIASKVGVGTKIFINITSVSLRVE